MSASTLSTTCLASTNTSTSTGTGTGKLDPDHMHATDADAVSCIQEAQLSPDGTCIFTSDYNRTFSVYPVGNSLLQDTGTRKLIPYAKFGSSDPIWAFAVNPHFDINNGSSTTVLVSRRDQYVSLHNALWDVRLFSDEETTEDVVQQAAHAGPVDISTKLASYKLIDHLREAVRAPTSLAYGHHGTGFFAGDQNVITVFDFNYTNDPVVRVPTIPSKRNKQKGGGVGFKGQITALSQCPQASTTNANVVAAGARSRYVGLCDTSSGTMTTFFALAGSLFQRKHMHDAVRRHLGEGVSHLRWSPDGNYLYVAERSSDALLIYDVRKCKMLGYCVGRRALTKQRLGFDVWSAGHIGSDGDAVSHEVWAGGTDGKIRVWKDPCLRYGPVEADGVVEVGNGPVVAALVHPWGTLAVAARGGLELSGASKGKRRDYHCFPSFAEWGCLDILGLGAYRSDGSAPQQLSSSPC